MEENEKLHVLGQEDNLKKKVVAHIFDVILNTAKSPKLRPAAEKLNRKKKTIEILAESKSDSDCKETVANFESN